jgi:hypothetical protein
VYGCENWWLTFREEHRLWVYGNRILRRIFGTKREEVTGEWKRLHNEELYDLRSSPNIIKKNVMTRTYISHTAREGEVLVGKTETTWKN